MSETKKTREEMAEEAWEGAHSPISRQLNSAELAEADERAGNKPSPLAPQAQFKDDNPHLDPNVDRGGRNSTAGPSRTEYSRNDAIAAGVVEEPPADAPKTTTNSSGLGAGPSEERNEAIRAENAKKASAPNTVSSASMQDEDGKTKPEFKGEAKAKAQSEGKDK